MEERIASGNAGVVYRAYDSQRGCDVAIKVSAPRATQNIESEQRYRKLFANEARLAGMLGHPNILQVYEAHLNGPRQYLVMEYIPGGSTLEIYCRPDQLQAPARVAELITKCAQALDFAHHQGVIHKDIKPANILLTPDDNIKIADFSLAYVAKPDLSQTEPGGFMGSPRYMSPEQFHEDRITHLTDIYSLGVVLYEMLTGRHPFETDTLSRLVYKVLNDDQPSLATVRPELPTSLQAIVKRAMHKNPARRYQTAVEMAEALAAAFAQPQSTLHEPEPEDQYASLSQLEFFHDFREVEVREIMRAARWPEYQPGDAIPLDAKDSDAFYVLIEGEATQESGGQSSRVFHAGECFGEFACPTAEVRHSTKISAQSPVLALRIDSDGFQQLSAACQQEVYRVLLRSLAETAAKSVSPKM